MKCNKISLLIVGLVAFGFSACGNDDSFREPEPTDSRMVMNFNFSHPSQSRATETSFEVGDRVGLYVTDSKTEFEIAGNVVNNEKATFGASGIAQSIANTISQEMTISWEQGSHVKLVNLLGTNILTVYFGPRPAQILSISALLLITVIIIAIVLVLFKKTTLGSNVYALGANEETARLSGIDNVKWNVGIYALSGFLASLAGMIVMIRTNSLQPTVGDGLEFQAVVAAVLGGNSMKGGKGSVPGAVLGALTLYTVRNAMSLWGIDTSVVMVVIGCILVFGMMLNQVVNSLAEKRKLYRRAEGREA